MMFDRHRVGRLAELRVAEELINLGYVPSEPVIDTRYDFVVEMGEELLKVQVKKANHRKKNSIAVELRNTKRDRNGNNEKRKYTEDEVDVFAIWSDVTDDVYWFYFDEVGSRQLNICIKENITGWNRKEANLAQDYKIQNRIEPNRDMILDREVDEEPEYESATSW